MTRGAWLRPGPAEVDDGPPPLAGFTVAIASDRRRHPLAGMLESVGARTVSFQVFRTFSQPDEPTLKAATSQCLQSPADEVVISSAVGLRAWLAAARRWNLASDLVRSFAQARLLARDPAAADSLRALGLTTIWSTAGASTEELLRYLLAQPLNGRRIVVQSQDPTLQDVCFSLRAGQAEVIEVPTYWSTRPLHYDFLRRLTDLVVRQQVDAVVFLAQDSTRYLLDHATTEGTANDLLNALRSDVLCVALSSLTGQRLAQAGVRPLMGEAPFIEEMADVVLNSLPATAVKVEGNDRELEIRGQAVVLDGQFIAIQPGPLAVLRVLARQPGRLVSMADLRAAVPGWHAMDDHAIEMAISRLRRALEGTDLVQTVVRRGYRLSL